MVFILLGYDGMMVILHPNHANKANAQTWFAEKAVQSTEL
jgi:hypothetical protein